MLHIAFAPKRSLEWSTGADIQGPVNVSVAVQFSSLGVELPGWRAYMRVLGEDHCENA